MRSFMATSYYSRIIMLGMLTCCAATATVRDVVCSPDPNILWKVPKGKRGCPHVPWQMAAASDPKVPCVLPQLSHSPRATPTQPQPAVSSHTDPLCAQVVARYPNPVLVNVGANKGYAAGAANVPLTHPKFSLTHQDSQTLTLTRYAAAEFLAIWSQHNVNSKLWHHALIKYARGSVEEQRSAARTGKKRHGFLSQQACGACRACKVSTPSPHQRSGGTVHMLELLESNRALLHNLTAATGISDIAKVHDLAASNVTHRVYAPRAYAGMEMLAAVEGTKKRPANQEAISLDDLFERQALSEAYLVSIDTEGSDALVLEGMQQLLQQGRVAFLEFEVGKNKGYWQEKHPERRRLDATISRLLEFGYFCFFEAGSQLAPISSPCWSDALSSPPWANVLCAKEGTPALGVLWRQAQGK